MHRVTHRKTVLIGALLAGAGLVALWPVSYNEPTTKGIDAYEYHGPLFGNHSQSQIISAAQTLESMGALLVPLRRSRSISDVEVTFSNVVTNEVLQTKTIPGTAITDDQFTYITLEPTISANQPVRVTFTAPQATADTALGIRFHPEDVYPAGGREFDGKTVPGDLALALQQRWPAWQVLKKVVQHNPSQARLVGQALIISVAFAVAASQIGWSHQPARRRRHIELTILLLLALATAATRLPALQLLGGVSGGDPYNYLFITDAISHGENPFATKRLPGYPLLLLPAYLTSVDDHFWMRLINVASAGAVVFLVALLARRLHVPWSVQLAAALLLAWQKDFYLISLRPEPYTLYACLLLASLVLFFSLTHPSPGQRRRWQPILFGVTLGYAAMTRQEGFVLALLLGIAALVHTVYLAYQQRSLGLATGKKYLIAFVPALLLVLPFFINNAIAYGNPIYTPYFEGERLNIVDSWPAALDAAGATWGIISSTWKTNWDQLERVDFTHSLVAVGALLSLLWWVYHTYRLPKQRPAESFVVIAASLFLCIRAILLFSRGVSHFASPFLMLSAGLLIASPLAFIARARWAGVLIVIITLSQILIATWFHPFPKHYQQNFALISLAAAVTLIARAAGASSGRIRAASAVTSAAWIFFFSLAIVPLYEPDRFQAMLDDQNQHAAFDSVLYRAIQMARTLPGPYGLDEAYLPARLYFPHDSYYYNLEEVAASNTEAQHEWLDKNDIKTVIITNSDQLLTPPPGWHRVKSFKAEGDNERLFESVVYTRSPLLK